MMKKTLYNYEFHLTAPIASVIVFTSSPNNGYYILYFMGSDSKEQNYVLLFVVYPFSMFEKMGSDNFYRGFNGNLTSFW